MPEKEEKRPALLPSIISVETEEGEKGGETLSARAAITFP